MFTPVLLFAFAGIMVGLATTCMNPQIMGDLANPESIWYKFWAMISAGANTVFNQLPVLFAVSLPIALAGIAIYLHNKFYDKELPDYLGVFKGSAFVVMIGFFVMIPVAILIALVWPHVQSALLGLQGFFKASGAVGLFTYNSYRSCCCHSVFITLSMHRFCLITSLWMVVRYPIGHSICRTLLTPPSR